MWHKATLLFVLWGCYHGVLLILHRQLQQLQKRLGWESEAKLWGALSWLLTIGLISLGWIFFRATSLGEAQQMLTAVVSPSTYGSHFLSGSLYLLITGLIGSYAMVVVAAKKLSPYSVQQTGTAPNQGSGTLVWVERKLWLWLPPLYALTLLAVTVVTFTQGNNAAQLVYRKF